MTWVPVAQIDERNTQGAFEMHTATATATATATEQEQCAVRAAGGAAKVACPTTVAIVGFLPAHQAPSLSQTHLHCTVAIAIGSSRGPFSSTHQAWPCTRAPHTVLYVDRHRLMQCCVYEYTPCFWPLPSTWISTRRPESMLLPRVWALHQSFTLPKSEACAGRVRATSNIWAAVPGCSLRRAS
jgi:hypothetical protein